MSQTSKNLSDRGRHREPVRSDASSVTGKDWHLFNEGLHFCLHKMLGFHPLNAAGVPGTYYAVLAPNPERDFVSGEFSSRNPDSHPLICKGPSGIWEGFVSRVGRGWCKWKVPIGCHVKPVPRENWRVGVLPGNVWSETRSSDDPSYGGDGVCNPAQIQAELFPSRGRTDSLNLVLPSLGVEFLKGAG